MLERKGKIGDCETYGDVQLGRSEELNRGRHSGACLDVYLKVDLNTGQVDLDRRRDQERVRDCNRDVTDNGGLGEGKAEGDLLLHARKCWGGDTGAEKGKLVC